jgi:hypothetical protein
MQAIPPTDPRTGPGKVSIKGKLNTSSKVQAGEEGIRFLLVSGKPIEEPVAWYGPIVMNTQEELRQAVTELWLYVAKYRELFKHLERIFCARKTCVSYCFILSCHRLDVRDS